MAIKLTNSPDEFDHVFMISQSLCQRLIDNINESAYYTLSVIWTYYKVELDGTITMSPDDPVSFYDENFGITAYTIAAGGDNTHISTLIAQQDSIKRLVEDFTGLSAEVV